MAKVLNMLFGLGGLGARHDDDLTDRLVSRYSATLFVAFAFIVTTSTYVGSPIHCWCPAQFTDTHTSYANAKCLISPTYSIPFYEVLPQETRREKHINYYVWVPFILLSQSLLCVIPSIVWKSCYKGVGFNIPSIVERLESSQNLGWESRENAVKYVVQQLVRYAEGYRNVCCKGPGATCCCIGKSSGNYLACCYLAIKFCYVIVSAGQFLLLNWFLGMDFTFFGLDMLNRIISGGDTWTEMERFPKVTICEFSVRHMHRVHAWVVQCVLPINLFNEKIFIFIWFWLAFLSVCTLFSFLKWIGKSIFWLPQLQHVKSRLRLKSAQRPPDFKPALVEFTTKRLRRDAVFVLRLLSHNLGAMCESEVLKGLWDNYYSEDDATPGSSRDTPDVPHFPTLKDVVVQSDHLHEH